MLPLVMLAAMLTTVNPIEVMKDRAEDDSPAIVTVSDWVSPEIKMTSVVTETVDDKIETKLETGESKRYPALNNCTPVNCAEVVICSETPEAP